MLGAAAGQSRVSESEVVRNSCVSDKSVSLLKISNMLEDTNNSNSSSLASSSHCWEEDGSFHSVCIFVLSVSGFCSLAAIFTVYRIVRLIIEAVR